MASLNDKRVLVFGATGNVGSGVAWAALEAGASVVLPARSPRGEAELRAQFAGQDAHVVLGDVSDGRGAEELARRIREEHDPLDHVVASLGAWWRGGRLVDQTHESWESVRRMLLDSHVHAARTTLPLLSGEKSSYVIITGVGAERPLPDASLLTIALGGTLALSRLLRAEHRGGVRVNEVRIAARVEANPRPGVVLARDFGAALVRVLASEARGAVIPFRSAESFDPNARIDEAP